MGKWIGVDLDGTLAEHNGKAGSPIGEPLKPMLDRVKEWIKDCKEVRVFTARADSHVERLKIMSWLKKHEISGLQITNKKDWEMVELWDDRAIRVERNKGTPCGGCVNQSSFSDRFTKTCC